MWNDANLLHLIWKIKCLRQAVRDGDATGIGEGWGAVPVRKNLSHRNSRSIHPLRSSAPPDGAEPRWHVIGS